MKKICVAIIGIITAIILTAHAENLSKSFIINSSCSDCKLNVNETVTLEIEIVGLTQSTQIIAKANNQYLCDLDWGKMYKTDKGGALPLIIHGRAVGQTDIKIYLVDHEDSFTIIHIDVVGTKGIITFMGIDWDITPEEFDHILLSKSIEYNKTSNILFYPDKWFRFDGIPFEPPYSYNMEVPSKSYRYESTKSTKSKSFPFMKVADYNVSQINATFKASYSIKSKKIGAPYRLARAEYEIWDDAFPKAMTAFDVYEDLINKLSSLYGNPTGSENSSNYLIKKTWWHASDGTGVSLQLYESIGIYHINIVYGVADEAAYLNDIFVIRQWEKQQITDSGNTNGL